MPRHPSILAALVAASAMFAAPALAQQPPDMGQLGSMAHGAPHHKMFTFGVGGGLAVPVNDAKDALNNGFSGLAYARAQLPGFPISFGVNVTFQRFDLKDATVSTTVPGANASGTTDMLGGLGDLRYDLMPGPIHPYITLGIGAYNIKNDYSSDTTSGSSSKTEFGINGGAGLSVRMGPINGYVQARVDNVYTSTGGTIDAKSIQVVPVTLGIEF